MNQLNLTEQKETFIQNKRVPAETEKKHKNTEQRPKPTVNFKNCSCVCIIVHNCRTQHSTEQFW